ncbi:siderophore-interacting protein [Actinomyces sp. zg296]|uniref:siderophore-interacting protein n=1 Tax=Actinomyces sp. zg296 TaxID=2609289 RepID=UPI001F1CC82E|nr:siderophore-interacting protein [Actinomyces sp. zg296]
MSGAGRAPFGFFPVEVAGILDVSPSMRRFTFVSAGAPEEGGDPLADFADPGWDQRIKLVLPAPSGGYEHLVDGPDWYTAWLACPPEHRCPIRTYTTRAVRRAVRGGGATEVDVDMVVHPAAPTGGPGTGLGPAARWIGGAVVGSRAVLLGPRRSFDGEPGGVDFIPPARTGAYLLGGDETAAPAIARILEGLPTSARGIAVVEMPRQADRAYLPAHPGFELRFLGREGGAHGELLTAAVVEAAAELCPPGRPTRVEEIDVDSALLWEVPRTARGGAALSRTDLYAWLAGEAGAVRAMRRHLVSERGVDRRAVAFMGYWRLGRAEN